MNCISALRNRWPAILASGLLLSGCGAPASESDASDERDYKLDYRVRLLPADGRADVEMHVGQSRALLREVRFPADDVSELAADGELQIDGGEVRWLPPASGGVLRWQTGLRRERGSHFDAWLDPGFGLFRAEDLIPRASTRTLRGATSRTTLRIDTPAGWSVVSEYRERGGRFVVPNGERRFKQPTGWIVAGDLGVRRDRIAGIAVAIAAPENHDVRRLDVLALLNWTLPELTRIVPGTPARLTIVSAGEPMWRGGLSAPASVYIHAERPLISENATSTLLHELVHVLLPLDTAPGHDWIEEGLAEFYSLEVLRRSGGITPERHARALDDLADWANEADTLCGGASRGAKTALAVTRLAALDSELRAAGIEGIDALLPALTASPQPVGLASLRAAAAKELGESAAALDNLPGCRSIAPD